MSATDPTASGPVPAVPTPSGMTPRQASFYQRFAHTVTTSGWPTEVQIFLLTLRQHQLLAGMSGAMLAHRAAELQRAPERQRAQNPALPHGSTGERLIGHTLTGRYSGADLSSELNGRRRMPRPELVQAVAEAYAERTRQPPGPVLDRLTTLRTDALNAARDQERQRRGTPGASSL